MELIPCRVCRDAPNRYPLTTLEGVDLWCTVHHCRGKMQPSEDEAAAEWNAANAPTSAAVLALARLVARLCRDQLSPTGGFSHAPYAVLDRMGVEEGVLIVGYPDATGPVMKDGIRKAIADILGPIGGCIMGGNEEL